MPPYTVCEEKKGEPDCTHLTSGDQCDVSIVGDTGSTSTLSCALEVVDSVLLIGGPPNCSATLSAVDGIPSVVSHDCVGIAFL